MKPPIILFASALFLVAVCVLVFLQYRSEVDDVSSVKAGYLLCIASISNEETADCLSELADIAYKAYPVADITRELDSVPMSAKNKWCHEMMHYMGWSAYKAEGDIAKAFLNSSELCDSGMYHGVVEQHLRTHGLEKNIEELVRTTCETSLAAHPDLSGGTLGLCYHGLGHGLMYVTSSDLKRSLELCDEIEGSAAERCYGGVLMENTASKALGPLANDHDLLDFSYCEGLSKKHRPMCYRRQGQNNFSATNGNIPGAVALCMKLPEEHWIGCFEGIGSNNPAPSKKHADAARACATVRDTLESAYLGCIRGSLAFVLSLERGDTQGAEEFCGALPAADQTYCEKEAGIAVSPWITETYTPETACAVFETETGKESCLSAFVR